MLPDPAPATDPLVSVVIPCYNVRDYVEATVASVLAQTYERIEIICVDDGSADGTPEMLRRLEAEHPERIRVLEGPHSGAPAARNAGFAEAKGTFVQFLDADDLLVPTKTERHVALAQETEADIVAGTFLRCYDDGREVLREAGEETWTALVWSQMGVTSANLFRREAVEAVGGWREGQHSSQEYELMFRILKRGGAVAFDDEVVMRKGIRDDSISGPYDAPVRESYLALCADVFAYLQEQGTLTPAQEQTILDSIFVKVRNLYPLDPGAAMRHHRRAVPPGYTPGPKTGTGALFSFVYKLFGLRAAERLRAFKS
ncbi:MAG: glycosyltransferase family A protein [Bacteroidota bacterium]